MSTVTLHNGDCLEVLRTLPDNSIDAIVSDPPYGINFMNKGWDNQVPGVDVWAECLRVLKPGGHLLAFAGTRTQHRMATRIEDAGFEIRDMIAWLYGSGFPKSLDVSKAIDKCGGRTADFSGFSTACREAMAALGVTRKQVDAALGNQMSGHYFSKGSQPALPGARDYAILKEMLQLGDRFDDVFLVPAEREVVGSRETGDPAAWFSQSDRTKGVVDITIPATDEAAQWQGWGTALKPALEPITVARKPLKGTVAATVLEYGTGAINIDGCRIGTEERINKGMSSLGVMHDDEWKPREVESVVSGRWPANVCHDGSDEVVALFPNTKPTRPTPGSGKDLDTAGMGSGFKSMPSALSDNGGSAARYFYCAKASASDREDGLDAFEMKRGGPEELDPKHRDGTGEERQKLRRNVHPTVKPTELMRWLVRLVTPPGGIVLDPFMGSGSTGRAAVLEGNHFVGIELDPDYVAISAARIAASKAIVLKEAAE